MEGQIILMRHANDYMEGKELAVSRRDCDYAIDCLSRPVDTGRGVIEAIAKGTPILHSDRPRARLTAEKVGSSFDAELFESDVFGDLSMSGRVDTYPRDFAGLVATELGAKGTDAWQQTGSVLVIGHEPLVAAANGRHRVPHCYPFLFDREQYEAMISLAIERRSLSGG